MFIAIIGTRFAGKSTVQSYLVKHKGFIAVKITRNEPEKVLLKSNLFARGNPNLT